MTAREVVRTCPSTLRIHRWQGQPEIAMVVPVHGGTPASTADVEVCLNVLRQRGYRRAYTTALGLGEQRAFVAAGFSLYEHLHLLEHPLHELPAPRSTPWPPRRHRRWELRHVLDVDREAFDEFWRFDERSLRDARRATPTSRLRVVGEPSCVGYAVFGRAQNRGYLQRLAVRPDMAGRGLGTSLVLDGLAWLRRHGADHAVVNTQVSNERAFALYRQLGFRPQPVGLAVLSFDVAHDLPAS